MDINALIEQIETQEQDFILTALQTYNKEVRWYTSFITNQSPAWLILIKIYLALYLECLYYYFHIAHSNTIVNATWNQLQYFIFMYTITYCSNKYVCSTKDKSVYGKFRSSCMKDNMDQERTMNENLPYSWSLPFLPIWNLGVPKIKSSLTIYCAFFLV